ncbi:hypothetical protein G5B32_00080 [Sphingobacterium sp. SGL-16]|nr:hypothetical protein [Sphingobacterium sp. SGL-16]
MSYGQGYVTVVFDSKHLAIVGENGVVRSAAESSHTNNLKVIKNRLDDITINLNSVVLVQDIIYSSLTEVDQALRSGLTVKQIVALGAEIFAESNLMLEMAKDSPHLLLFAEEIARQLKNRGINLVAEVSEFVLKEGSNVLMDFSKRDQLLRKIVIELRVIRALVYSMHRAMYWAKARGVLRSLNPYSQFIYQDKRMVEDIIYKINQLKN